VVGARPGPIMRSQYLPVRESTRPERTSLSSKSALTRATIMPPLTGCHRHVTTPATVPSAGALTARSVVEGDNPDLTVVGHHIGVPVSQLQRRGSVEVSGDHVETAIFVSLHQRAGVGHSR
jgi:hypothetical protein